MTMLSACLEKYLALRGHMGFKLYHEHKLLPQFVMFCQQHGSAVVTTPLALRWATQPADCQPARWAARLRMVRRFAHYLSSVDSRTEIPPLGLLADSYRRKTPCLFRDHEVSELIDLAQQLDSAQHLLGPTISTLIGLLAVTGMRVGEALALDRQDVDLKQSVLYIRKGKGNKPRLVPVHPSTRKALRQYARLRDRTCPRPQTAHFFLIEKGARLADWTARRWFIRIRNQIGLRGSRDRRAPGLHTLRHRFAIQTLVRWYRNDQDVEAHLPELATYLGHVNIAKTYWYLSATPELLSLARKRCERRNANRRL